MTSKMPSNPYILRFCLKSPLPPPAPISPENHPRLLLPSSVYFIGLLVVILTALLLYYYYCYQHAWVEQTGKK